MQLISTELGESGAKNGHFPLFEWFIFGANATAASVNLAPQLFIASALGQQRASAQY